MTPMYHAAIDVKKYGGILEDYLPIHNWFDQTKACHADMRHRAILHSSFGLILVEQVFGSYITNSIGKNVPVRQIAEDHLSHDLGFIPNVSDYLNEMKMTPWMMGSRKKQRNKKVTVVEE